MSEPAATPPPDTPLPASPSPPPLDDVVVPIPGTSALADVNATPAAGDSAGDVERPHTPPAKNNAPVLFNTPASLPSERPLSCTRKFQSQTLPISTLRTEAGSEASRLRVGPVSMTDFLRITFQRQFENVVENASQAISPNAQIGVSAKLQSVPTGDGVELEIPSGRRKR
ncbi:hypothetical protein GLOTRDRAFT_133888 [Gloeophyllum trabeum ATCC 11539]|uniref:Uncharacterized protein n=1 Tax=Gloeophyllum trabeum (strain ATCC 11539 / FP-39264 / Madison 617) TaxID=670483 RepID=S7PT17_GLOTA|nr:uncharacterized protein GLOTRDRAFT_133888 [Gloeophyllum trabeum ATCC 11539]EPQ50518.1 hypothetical protein GLOTRDRAFT_133888 [Gloeophyllum trabeum ATCC 11539]